MQILRVKVIKMGQFNESGIVHNTDLQTKRLAICLLSSSIRKPRGFSPEEKQKISLPISVEKP